MTWNSALPVEAHLDHLQPFPGLCFQAEGRWARLTLTLLVCGRKAGVPGGNSHRHEENMTSTQKSWQAGLMQSRLAVKRQHQPLLHRAALSVESPSIELLCDGANRQTFSVKFRGSSASPDTRITAVGRQKETGKLQCQLAEALRRRG